jgi:hypothetical protein
MASDKNDAKNFPVIRKYKKAESMEFNRPDHPDFKDSSELKKMEFSGIRHNKISHEWEIWTLGDLRAHGNDKDQEGFMKAYMEVFAIENVLFIAQEYKGIQQRIMEAANGVH